MSVCRSGLLPDLQSTMTLTYFILCLAFHPSYLLFHHFMLHRFLEGLWFSTDTSLKYEMLMDLSPVATTL